MNELVKISSPVEEGPFEPRIVAFFCNWCTYLAADLAGTSRLKYAPNIRVIRVMCSGRVDPQFILDAFRLGREALESLGAGPVHVPELVPPAEFHRYLALHPTSAMRGMASVLSRFLPLLSLPNRYHNSLASADLASSGLVRADVRDYFGKVVKYCVETNWGKTA